MGTFEFHPAVSDYDAINALALARAATRLLPHGNGSENPRHPGSDGLKDYGIDRYVELLERNA